MSDEFDEIPETVSTDSNEPISYEGVRTAPKFASLEKYVGKKAEEINRSLEKIISSSLKTDTIISFLCVVKTDNYHYKEHCKKTYSNIKELMIGEYGNHPELVFALDALDSAYKGVIANGIKSMWLAEGQF